jgi:hypothetical protein
VGRKPTLDSKIGHEPIVWLVSNQLNLSRICAREPHTENTPYIDYGGSWSFFTRFLAKILI